jgi:hypothetical protein
MRFESRGAWVESTCGCSSRHSRWSKADLLNYYTVVVHLQHTPLAHWTVVRSLRFLTQTLTTLLQQSVLTLAESLVLLLHYTLLKISVYQLLTRISRRYKATHHVVVTNTHQNYYSHPYYCLFTTLLLYSNTSSCKLYLTTIRCPKKMIYILSSISRNIILLKKAPNILSTYSLNSFFTI